MKKSVCMLLILVLLLSMLVACNFGANTEPPLNETDSREESTTESSVCECLKPITFHGAEHRILTGASSLYEFGIGVGSGGDSVRNELYKKHMEMEVRFEVIVFIGYDVGC